MKFNKYILLIIVIFIALVAFNLKPKSVYRPIGNGLRPGLPNSHVSLGRPMWAA